MISSASQSRRLVTHEARPEAHTKRFSVSHKSTQEVLDSLFALVYDGTLGVSFKKRPSVCLLTGMRSNRAWCRQEHPDSGLALPKRDVSLACRSVLAPHPRHPLTASSLFVHCQVLQFLLSIPNYSGCGVYRLEALYRAMQPMFSSRTENQSMAAPLKTALSFSALLDNPSWTLQAHIFALFTTVSFSLFAKAISSFGYSPITSVALENKYFDFETAKQSYLNRGRALITRLSDDVLALPLPHASLDRASFYLKYYAFSGFDWLPASFCPSSLVSSWLHSTLRLLLS